MSNSNPYAAPDADLTVKNSRNKIDRIKEFKRFTAWGVFGLSIITLGIYPIYWLYSRTNKVNTLLPRNKIAAWLLNGFLLLVILYYAFSIAPLAVGAGSEASVTLAMLGGVVTILYFVFYMTLIFAFRNRLNALNGSSKGEKFWHTNKPLLVPIMPQILGLSRTAGQF